MNSLEGRLIVVEYNIGIEMRDEYKSMEVAKGAMKLVRDIMLIKPGENVVINVDTATDMRVAQATLNAAYTIDASRTYQSRDAKGSVYSAHRPGGGQRWQKPMCGLSLHTIASCTQIASARQWPSAPGTRAFVAWM